MSKQAGTTKNVSTTSPWPAAQPGLENMLSEASKLYSSSGPAYYPGSTVANFSQPEMQAQQYIMNTAAPAAGAAATGAQSALDKLISGSYMDVANNPLVQNVVKGSTTDVANQFMRETLPGIRGGAQMAGQFGSSRQGIAEGLASGEASRNAMNTAAGINLGAYNTGLSALQTGLGMAPATQQMSQVPAEMYSAVGGQQRAMDQANIDSQMTKWQYEQNLPYVKLNEFANMVSKPLGGQSTTETVYPQVSGVQQGIGTALQGVNLFSQVMSLLKSLGIG
jgi:hypothetical protein